MHLHGHNLECTTDEATIMSPGRSLAFSELWQEVLKRRESLHRIVRNMKREGRKNTLSGLQILWASGCGSASVGCCLLSFSMMYEKVPKARQLWIRVCGAPATNEQKIRDWGASLYLVLVFILQEERGNGDTNSCPTPYKKQKRKQTDVRNNDKV